MEYRVPGTPVVWRFVHGDHVAAVFPSVVVVDDADHVVLYQPPGTDTLRRTGRRGGPRGRNMQPGGWDGGHARDPWVGNGVVRAHRRGTPWSAWRWVDSGGRWEPGFYVNLERPWLAGPLGYDSEDWILDLVIDTDLVGWTWKDEDELGWAQQVGAVSAEHAAEVRIAGAQALAAAQQGSWPFRARWDDWLPDPSWPHPAAGPHSLIVEGHNSV